MMISNFNFISITSSQDWINLLSGFIISFIITYILIIIKFNNFINYQIEINDQYRNKMTSQYDKHDEKNDK